ncbi:TM2 domain-containing protein almondex [Chrysoperla carnea]|uniref:TM2 domain-containing protein almondex n=1 Tax=Chrysoperla carnea TaxID=189513 RepID=UPI001D0806B4|nr:TM2 domain-containing protein almondex [Chrysoperla carnea]
MSANCIHLNWKSALFILFSLIIRGVHHTDSFTSTSPSFNINTIDDDDRPECPNIECSKLSYPCIVCDLSTSCIYGSLVNTTCKPIKEANCTGTREFFRTYQCKYCYQTDRSEHTCHQQAHCKSVSTPREYYRTNCTVHNNIICLGKRRFLKRVLCNWTSGYKWSTTLILSITLGGFGADRFYLGHWQEGIGKLFSFGGLGVWTLIDVLLISLHYLGPADGSLYI